MGKPQLTTIHSKKNNTVEDNEIVNWSSEELKDIPPLYGCQILLEKASPSQIIDPSFPSDAYIVSYVIEKKPYMDLCRGAAVKIFDMYYDKFGPGAITKIDWGYGKINPKLWGYKSPEKKKRK